MSIESMLYGLVTIFFMTGVWVFAAVSYNLTGWPPGFNDDLFFSTYISLGVGFVIAQGLIWRARRSRPKHQRQGSLK